MALTGARYGVHGSKARWGKVVSRMRKVWKCCKARARGIMELSICRGFFSSAQEEASDDSLEPLPSGVEEHGVRWNRFSADLSSSGHVTGSRMAEIIK